MNTRKIILFLFLTLIIQKSYSWGGRGHHSICDAASYLVKESHLKDFLSFRAHTMGHLCNVPDIYWKSLPVEKTKTGNPTHYFDFEILGLSLKEVPLDFQKIVDDYTGKPNQFEKGKIIFSVASEVGSNWWRANQLHLRAIFYGKQAAKADPPSNSKEEQSDSAFNNSVYEMMVSMGTMGHFVGDNAQPFHVTSDFDGYFAGHGGIHSFYEEVVVAEFKSDLQNKILQKAKQLKLPYLNSKNSTLQIMKELALQSESEIQKVYKLDQVLQKSKYKDDNGLKLKTAAKRKEASQVASKFEPLIVEQMARAALVLSYLWDRAYIEAGKPQMHKYKSYRYPFTPDFIEPDYYKEPNAKK
jgi:hypothetical protein